MQERDALTHGVESEARSNEWRGRGSKGPSAETDLARPVITSIRRPIDVIGDTIVTRAVRVDGGGRSPALVGSGGGDPAHTVFDHAPIGMAVVALDGRMLRVNPALCKLLGYTREEMLASDYRSMTSPEDVVLETTRLRSLVRGEVPAYHMEKRFLHREGREVWAHVCAVLTRDIEDRPDSIIFQVVDISARRAAEERLNTSLLRQEELLRREQSLLQELDHRVRNNLASLTGLVRLYERAGRSADELSAAICGKIEAMRAVHEIITCARGRPVRLSELISTMTREQLPSDRRDLVELTGPQVWVEPGQAGALAIIIQELFTNSGKHGALSSVLGRVSIRWQFKPAGTGQGYVIIWQESGGPRVNSPRQPGVGLGLIQGFAQSDLQGSCRFVFDQSGYQCVISVGDSASVGARLAVV